MDVALQIRTCPQKIANPHDPDGVGLEVFHRPLVAQRDFAQSRRVNHNRWLFLVEHFHQRIESPHQIDLMKDEVRRAVPLIGQEDRMIFRRPADADDAVIGIVQQGIYNVAAREAVTADHDKDLVRRGPFHDMAGLKDANFNGNPDAPF